MNESEDFMAIASANTDRLILIVDDLPDNLRVLSAALSGQGYQIRCAKSGEIALMAVKKTCPDLILLDIRMPEMDGYEVCQRLKASELTCNIPIIFLSAFDDVFDKVKAFEVGGADYITKPFQVEEVLIRVKHQISLKVAEAEISQLNQQLEQRIQQRTEQLEIINQDLQREIAERQLIEKSLKLSEEHLDSILCAIEHIVWSMDETMSKTFYLNAAVEKIYGYPISDLLEDQHLWLKIIHHEDYDRIKNNFYHTLLSKGDFNEEYRILRPDGEVRWVSNQGRCICDRDGNILRVDGIVRDITEQKKAQQQLLHDAFHDALTNLPNRSLFMERVEQALNHCKRNPQYLFAVMFIDLDRFKMINDSLGHAIGDQFLQAIAKLLAKCLRGGDTVARIGGDEFTILINDMKEITDAVTIADRILKMFLQPIELEKQTIFGSVSIGIVIRNREYNTADDLLRDADIAMYRSKSLGRGRYTFFDKEMYEQNLKMIHLENDLRYALKRQEFEIHYQPIMHISSGKLAGFEALIRWQHPARGLLSPIEFIPIAEETGLIIAIGDWVLHQACQQICTWQSQFLEANFLTMSVNLASQQVQEKNLIERLDRVLATTGIDGNNLRLEITETSMMDQSEETIAKLEELRARNIQLSIDDFGQGYSSLSYLHRFPVNTLKIDRSFVELMGLGGQNLSIVRTIILLAHTLNMSVVAEGVETLEQISILKQLGCEYGQGYFFSRPMTAVAAEQFIKNQNLTSI